MTIRTARLGVADGPDARRLFALMAHVFDEECAELSDEYVTDILCRPEFWALAAYAGDEIVGGLTAHTLPMTRAEGREIFVYDIAVRAASRRRGIGRQLMSDLRTQAAALGISDVFVAADDGDSYALDFYRALGGAAAAVTMFTFR